MNSVVVELVEEMLQVQAQWIRRIDGSWVQVLALQSWGEDDTVPPPDSLTDVVSTAARRIQKAWRRARSVSPE